MKYIKILSMAIGISSLWSYTAKAQLSALAGKSKHVIVIGFDGLSADGLIHAATPNFHKIMQEGAYSFHARAVLPSSSSTNWATMIMGAGPEQHGITSNDWEKDTFTLPAIVQGEDFLFPTIFSLIDKQIPNAEIGAIYHWDGFGRLFEKNAVDYDVNTKTEEETAKVASAYIIAKKPTFTFIHFDHIDHAGHEFGHGTPEYYQSVEKADALLATLFQAIATAGIADETMVIISSDHGGVGQGHGGESLQEVEIPFIVWGKSIKKNLGIKTPVYQYDNAATVAYALGVSIPTAWVGKPVLNVFEGINIGDDFPVVSRYLQPVLLPDGKLNKKSGGLFEKETMVVIQNLNTSGEVLYTTDGTMPSKNSNRYRQAFKINKNTVVKSAVFNEGKINSLVSEAFYRIKEKGTAAPIDYSVYYLDTLTDLPNVDQMKPDFKGQSFEITSDEVKAPIKDNTVVQFTTKIRIDKEDTYTFYLRSDDGSKLWIDSKLITDNDGDHGVKEKSGQIMLKPGIYSLQVGWFNGGGNGWLDVFYKSSIISKQIIPTTVLTAQ
ncbi:alkaline phosphatase family protein [Flavobacterium sp. LB2R40]|uniref:alkaline phosphatase family protein n=1 Tax=unclassified Flavobacterium TaxID=196869 RepID=UPI003AAE83D7